MSRMRVEDVFIISDNIITGLGFTTEDNLNHICSGMTGIQTFEDQRIAAEPFIASLVDHEGLRDRFSGFGDPGRYSHFEQLIICSVRDALSRTEFDLTSRRTRVILSTTKGNVELMKEQGREGSGYPGVYLWQSGERIRSFFNLAEAPVIVSNACISGLVAIIAGVRMIRSGLYDHIVVTGADVVSEFIYSGFSSFMSLSQSPCRPFDKKRDGLSLGEGAGTMILSASPDAGSETGPVRAGKGFSSNDANHISGPSRTGEGLYIAITKTLQHNPVPVDHISAHGTATAYNDEMESVALARAGLLHVPVNSLKGYWGHTLGAAGIIESVAAAWSIRNHVLIGTMGFEDTGVSEPVNVISKTASATIGSCLKMASGFGGCNAALMYYK